MKMKKALFIILIYYISFSSIFFFTSCDNAVVKYCSGKLKKNQLHSEYCDKCGPITCEIARVYPPGPYPFGESPSQCTLLCWYSIKKSQDLCDFWKKKDLNVYNRICDSSTNLPTQPDMNAGIDQDTLNGQSNICSMSTDLFSDFYPDFGKLIIENDKQVLEKREEERKKKEKLLKCENERIDNLDCDWYKECLEERMQCGSEGYPLRYGNKYCNRFVDNLNEFSPKGQEWVKGTLSCLKRDLKDYLHRNKYYCSDLERDAFKSHPECYAKNGFCSLLVEISDYSSFFTGLFKVYEIKDFISVKAIQQVLDTLLLKCGKASYEKIMEFIRNYFKMGLLFLE